MDNTTFLGRLPATAKSVAGVPALVIIMLSMMVVPLPAFALDMLFTFNISLSLIILLVAVYTLRPLDFAVFPSLLLLATLLRLGLNVASTRVVLMNGHEGPGAAGQVIQAFGDFVIGGSYAIGLVVFVILVIINFVVVTKGAGRVSEVNARFTLDAMPGKQMAIDADLGAGLITQEEARARRENVGQEADFYGAMDGASKFVRGDAVAGILILIINIVGGLSVGTLQHGLPFRDAAQYYTLLTIGDGLVAQIPSLLLSTAAAIIVTRVSSKQDMGKQIVTQLFSSPRALGVTAAIIGLLGIIPGMPNVAFLVLAAAAGGAAYLIDKRSRVPEELSGEIEEPQQPTGPAELTWDDVHPVDIIGLELGYRLIPLVDPKQSGELLGRIKGVRRKLSQELGFLIHAVHIRDNLDLTPNHYRISLMGVPIGQAEIHMDRDLAINPGQVFGTLEGIRTKDPAFGLDAIWIGSEQRELAQTMGYTVVDVSTVIATHLSTLIQEHAHELLGHEEVQQLLTVLARQAPKLVEDLVPKTVPLSVVVRVLQNLLEDRVPIRDMRTIAETLAEHGPRSQDPVVLCNAVRESFGRSIVQNINGLQAELEVMTLSPDLEHLLQQSRQGGNDGGMGLEPGLAQQLHSSLKEIVEKREVEGKPSVLVVTPQLRAWLARWLRPSLKALHVLGINEIPDNKQIRVVSTVGQDNPRKR